MWKKLTCTHRSVEDFLLPSRLIRRWWFQASKLYQSRVWAAKFETLSHSKNLSNLHALLSLCINRVNQLDQSYINIDHFDSITMDTHLFVTIFCVLSVLGCSLGANAQLSPNFYGARCPRLQIIVRDAMRQAVIREPRLGASILRLFFHDCFVNVRTDPISWIPASLFIYTYMH